MRYVSLFSGIEAASVAWEPLGWEPVAFSEIEPFPCAVLKERYPEVPNLGDVCRVDWSDYAGSVDLVVGGSPCQSFSVAGGREGLDGASGLMWEYVRAIRELRPRWLLWENVPGALSSRTRDAAKGDDFRCLLSALDDLGYGLAWRVLDAQFFGVAQRRRRVFVVGCLGDPWRAAEVLFEPECLRWDHPSSAVKRKELAAVPGGRALVGGAEPSRQDPRDADGGRPRPVRGEGQEAYDAECLTPWDNQTSRVYVVHGTSPTLSANENGGFNTGAIYYTMDGDIGGCLTPWDTQTNRVYGTAGAAPTLSARGSAGQDRQAVAYLPFNPTQVTSPQNGNNPKWGDPCHTLAATDYAPHVACRPEAVVRRLMPVECERLQGFPDGWTDIEVGGKPASDTARYKALGNSIAVPVMCWIGWRIQSVDGPEGCPHSTSRLDGKKAYCSLWERWTNCLEAGHCTYETIAGEMPGAEGETWD